MKAPVADGAGDLHAAFDVFYEAHFTRIYTFALRRVRDEREAQSVTQDVLTAVTAALEREPDPGALLREDALASRVLGLTLARLRRSERRSARVTSRPTSSDLSTWGEGHG